MKLYMANRKLKWKPNLTFKYINMTGQKLVEYTSVKFQNKCGIDHRQGKLYIHIFL